MSPGDAETGREGAVTHPDDREPQRVLGMPTGRGDWRVRSDDTRPRVLGVPVTWVRPRPVDLRWVRHPVRWVRWRRDVHRRGPYAPDFDDCA